MNIKIIPAYDYPREIEALFSEYTHLLLKGDPSFRKYLDIQHYDEEVKNLEIKYGLPYGRLYLALYKGEAAGCIGLRKIDGENCEMKRLYVRPQFRGRQIVDRLIERIIKDACFVCYSHILLDPLSFFQRPFAKFSICCFYMTDFYIYRSMDSSIYMRFDL